MHFFTYKCNKWNKRNRRSFILNKISHAMLLPPCFLLTTSDAVTITVVEVVTVVVVVVGTTEGLVPSVVRVWRDVVRVVLDVVVVVVVRAVVVGLASRVVVVVSAARVEVDEEQGRSLQRTTVTKAGHCRPRPRGKRMMYRNCCWKPPPHSALQFP
jgi:hypothetical protein